MAWKKIKLDLERGEPSTETKKKTAKRVATSWARFGIDLDWS